MKSVENARMAAKKAGTMTKAVGILMMGMAAAGFMDRDVAVVGHGMVAPGSKSRPVSHFEGGVVSEVLVHDGEVVKAGQPLIRLSKASAGASVEELMSRRDSLRGLVARLEAEAEGKAPVWPEGLSDEVVGRQKATFDERRAALAASVNAMRSKLEGLRRQAGAIGILVQRYSGGGAGMAAARRDEEAAKLAAVQGEIAGLEPQITSEQIAFRAKAREESDEAAGQLREVEARLKSATDREDRTEIASPVDGIVQALAVRSPGEAVQAGKVVAEIVPTGGEAVFEVKIDPKDRKGLVAGLPAIVRLSSAGPLDRPLEGKVISVSPNAFPGQQGEQPYYRVEIAVAGEGVMPGLDGSAHVKLGERPVWEYALGPVFSGAGTAFTER